jgi:hypothetical protein
MKLDPNTQYITVYVKHMADELAELAAYAGCGRLSELFALASIEAENCAPVVPARRRPIATARKTIERPVARILAWRPKSRPAALGSGAADKIEATIKGDHDEASFPGKTI